MHWSTFIESSVKPYTIAFRILKKKNFIVFSRKQSGISDLKEIVASKIPKEIKEIVKFRKAHGNTVLGQYTVNMVYGGMRGIKGLIGETSSVDPEKGIRFRGYSIPELKEKLPRAKGSCEPLPEALFWLLLTEDIPTEKQTESISLEWSCRAKLPQHITSMIKQFPKDLHPMSQLSSAVMACNSDSKMVKAYTKGVKKTTLWEYVYEDGMDLIARIPIIAAQIYQNTFKSGKLGGVIDTSKDWSYNFSKMLGYEEEHFVDLMRLYLVLHSDHETGNVSAHASHLVASALSDPYLSYAAGMNGLAGPLHGLANQEVLVYLEQVMKDLGASPSDDQMEEYLWKTLKSGRVIPGFGHAVLRKTDPRYIAQQEFAKKNLPDDPLFKLVSQMFKVAPKVLKATGKVQNPWPNVDAISGTLLQHYGMIERSYYTVLFGVSRALGMMAHMIWARALGLPIERPKSISLKEMQALVKASGSAGNKPKENAKPKGKDKPKK